MTVKGVMCTIWINAQQPAKMGNILVKIPHAKYVLDHAKHVFQILNVQNAKSGTFCVMICVFVPAKKDVTDVLIKILLSVNNVSLDILCQLK